MRVGPGKGFRPGNPLSFDDTALGRVARGSISFTSSGGARIRSTGDADEGLVHGNSDDGPSSSLALPELTDIT